MAYSVPALHQNRHGLPILQGLQESSATPQHTPGDTREFDDGRVFQYAYMQSSDVKMYSGRPMVWVDTTGDYVVTPDCSDATGGQSAAAAAGFAGLATMNNIDVNAAYIWMQTKGLADSVLVSAVVAVNDQLIVTDEDCLDDLTPFHTSATSTNYKVIGHALTAAAEGVASLHSTASVMLI